MKSRLDQIESHIRTFIEGSALFLPWNKNNVPFSHRLMDAMQDALREEEGERITAPSIYTIYIHPVKLGYWKARQDIFNALAQAMQDASLETNVKFDTLPSLRLAEDPFLDEDQIRIQATYLEEKMGNTTGILRSSRNEDALKDPQESWPENAFLVINGNEIFPLHQTVINIGRKSDNQLVLDDPRISRNHAQLRASRGHFVLFDLNSTGGTYVNGLRITQHTLKPGDVITLAGVVLIYGQDNYSSGGYTGELFPPSNTEGMG